MRNLEPNNITDTSWLFEEEVQIGEQTLPIQYFHNSILFSGISDYRSEYFLIGKNILVIVSSGIPSEDDVRRGAQWIEKIISEVQQEKFYLIWDIRGVKRVGPKVRKIIDVTNAAIQDRFIHQFLIISGNNRIIFKLYQLVNPEKSMFISMSSSIKKAVEHIIDRSELKLSWQRKGLKAQHTKEELSALSKDELIEKILNAENHRKDKTFEIFEALGKISWDENFAPISIKVEADDPYYELISAINSLQYDVHEIISDLIDLNQNLELKVAERIVDIIDKESNLRAIVDNADSQVWLINNRYELIDFNNQFIEDFTRQHSQSPEVGKNIFTLLTDPMEIETWQKRYEHALAGKPGIYIDEIISDGVEKIMEVKTFPINEVGNIKGVSIFVKDITELKRSELKLIQKNRDLEKVNSELDSFVYRVSHDLRAPLTSILGIINLLKIETNLEKQQYYIDLQATSVHKLDNFIQDIINLSRNSRQEMQVEEIDFETLIRYIFEGQHFSEHADVINKKIKIEQENPFFTDKKRLGIVLNNLISNGIKYCNPRQDDPLIEVLVKISEDKAIISVRDNGIGIPDSHLNKIFTMFYRAHQDNSGSGLGLYIVKETVDKLYGNIAVQSKTRQGSTFTVTIPNLKEMMDMPTS